MINCATSSGRRGLGLPEILVIVALIFLFFTVAIPWRNAAALRAGVARSKSDLRRMGQALDEYFVDQGAYPPSVDSPARTRVPQSIYGAKYAPPLVSHRFALAPLTTPVAYLESVDFNAPFPAHAWEINEAERSVEPYSYWYNNYNDFWRTARGAAVAPVPQPGYLLLAFGPISQGVGGISAPYRDLFPQMLAAPAFARPNIAHVYDPTNGLSSDGNLLRFGGNLGLEDGVPYYPG